MRAVLLRPNEQGYRGVGPTAVVVVGEGLIGAAVTRRLRRRAVLGERHVPIRWDQPEFCLLYTSPSPRDRG